MFSCKEYQNLNAFFALIMGLSNGAVSRLTQTWERLPSKLRKMFNEFDSLIEPSRNHRAYRIAVGKLQPPIIPFMPLLLKGIFDGINIEPVGGKKIDLRNRYQITGYSTLLCGISHRYDVHSRRQPHATGQCRTSQFRKNAHGTVN